MKKKLYMTFIVLLFPLWYPVMLIAFVIGVFFLLVHSMAEGIYEDIKGFSGKRRPK